MAPAATVASRAWTGWTPWSIGATAAVTAMAGLATGDALLAGALLAVAARDAMIGPAVVSACAASMVRWGTASLAGIGADQAVLGIAGAVGPSSAAASAWCAAAALVLAPRDRAPHAALASGALAALLVAGPTGAGDWWIRAVATVATVATALVSGRVVPRPAALVVSTLSGAVALGLAIGA